MTALTLLESPDAQRPDPESAGSTGRRDDGAEHLYRTEHEPMVRLAFLMTGSRDAADDIVHEAFARLLDRDVEPDNPGGYLRRIVVNLARDHHRRAARLRVPRRTSAADVVLPPAVDETWAAVQRLPAAQRTAVVLRYYADLPYAEIAAAMGCPTGTAKSHVHRGIARLREVLDA